VALSWLLDLRSLGQLATASRRTITDLVPTSGGLARRLTRRVRAGLDLDASGATVGNWISRP
jgi:hypothetical protein